MAQQAIIIRPSQEDKKNKRNMIDKSPLELPSVRAEVRPERS
jgi:hypothetical protein